jgi:signal transduction histidine kinase
MIDKKYLTHASKFAFLVIFWLGAYKLSALAEVLKPYSSLWFLPAGVSLSIFLAAPGWLKMAPLVANLLLAIPGIDALFEVGENAARDQVIHALRHSGIYFAAACVIKKQLGTNWHYANLRGASTYIVVAAAASIASALSGISLHVLTGNFSWKVAADIVVHWAIGDAVAALVIPPLLVPVLRTALGASPNLIKWPPLSDWLFELCIILGAMSIAAIALVLDPALGSLWYITLLPPIFAGVRKGILHTAISVFLTASITPIVAKLVAYNGEPLALSVLLAITAIAALFVGTAVSVHQQTLKQLDAQNHRLEESVQTRTAELADAYEFERHLVRSLGHDLRQPLQTITMLVESMAMRKSNDEPMLNALKQISATMSNFLDGVLNYALTDPGTVKPHLARLTAANVFASLETIYRPIADKRGVGFVVERTPALLDSDEMLLRQALSNDLDNAIRLSAPGTIVTLRHELRNGQHALIVADQIAVEYANSPGTAGFGYGIVARVCTVLKATRIKEKNIRGILLPAN